MIKSFGSLYAGHVDFPDLGFDATPVNDRWLSEEQLNTVYSKAEAIAKTMDSNGFDIFWMAEHHFQREGYEVIPNLMLLAVHLAHITSQIRIGCGFNISPMWHPLRLAEDYATADILTKGRVVFGVGMRLHTREVEVFGNPMIDADANRNLYEEQVEIINKAFNEESFSHHGENYNIPPEVPYRGYNLENITVVPRPVNRPVECWQPIVSASERGLDFMARHHMKGIIGGGAATGGANDEVIHSWQKMQEKYGTETELGGNLCVGFSLHIAESEEKALEEARPFFEENMKMFAPLGFVRGLSDAQIDALGSGSAAKTAGLPTLKQSVEAGNWLVGTPESITEKLMKLQDRYPGLDMVNVGQVIGTPQEVIEEQLQRFGEEVIPHFS